MKTVLINTIIAKYGMLHSQYFLLSHVDNIRWIYSKLYNKSSDLMSAKIWQYENNTVLIKHWQSRVYSHHWEYTSRASVHSTINREGAEQIVCKVLQETIRKVVTQVRFSLCRWYSTTNNQKPGKYCYCCKESKYSRAQPPEAVGAASEVLPLGPFTVGHFGQ